MNARFAKSLSHQTSYHTINSIPWSSKRFFILAPLTSFLTGLPLSHGTDALLIVKDKFAKAIRLFPYSTTTAAEETATLYLSYCYVIFGLPVKLILDRDARFTSRFWHLSCTSSKWIKVLHWPIDSITIRLSSTSRFDRRLKRTTLRTCCSHIRNLSWKFFQLTLDEYQFGVSTRD